MEHSDFNLLIAELPCWTKAEMKAAENAQSHCHSHVPALTPVLLLSVRVRRRQESIEDFITEVVLYKLCCFHQSTKS